MKPMNHGSIYYIDFARGDADIISASVSPIAFLFRFFASFIPELRDFHRFQERRVASHKTEMGRTSAGDSDDTAGLRHRENTEMDLPSLYLISDDRAFRATLKGWIWPTTR